MTSSRRTVCVVTGSRADYGLLHRTLREIEADARLELRLLVTGAHLSAAHGDTVAEIERDGHPIAARVPLPLGDDTEIAVAEALAAAVVGLARALREIAPDLLVVLGDRYEILAAASAALVLRIPVVHLHGGESSEGQIDEAIRHAVTKMSHVHCVAADPYARRVLRMGEQPDRVHVVGALALDELSREDGPGRAELATALGIDLRAPTLLVTLHPETLSGVPAAEQAAPLLAALDELTDATVVVTGSNADPAGRTLSRCMEEWTRRQPGRRVYVESLGRERYLGMLRVADLVLGNSSSGIIEAPAAGCAVVNIGARQAGRLRAPAVIDCPNDSAAIVEAVRHALGGEHRAASALRVTPYGTPGAAARIREILATTPLEGLLRKRFHDGEAA